MDTLFNSQVQENTVVDKTLVFCTAYSNGEQTSSYTWKRYRLWIEAIQRSLLKFDQILLVDDGSATLPDWPDTAIVREADGLACGSRIVLYHFEERLGRRSATDFPGWVRSFFLPAAWAAANGFTRVIHIESDAFIVSERMQRFCNDVAEGWVAPWCPRYQWPESAIQIIAGSALGSYFEMAQRSLEYWRSVVIERSLPFTHIEVRLLGDRFGEDGDAPRNADWIAQANCGDGQSPNKFYWWLPSAVINRSGYVEPTQVAAVQNDERNAMSESTDLLTSVLRSRNRYLNILESSLTGSLVGDTPIQPGNTGKFDPATRYLGRDWPSLAQTMIGVARMRNLRQLCESAILNGIPGDFIETGVWRGGACIYMRGILEAYGDTHRRVFVADSFKGIPPPSPQQYVADTGDLLHENAALAISRQTVEENFRKYGLLDDRVVFLEGWFKDTLPVAPIEKLSVLRLDGDMYESTIQALDALYHKVSRGGSVVVDDYQLAPCAMAVNDFRARHGITSPLLPIDHDAVWWLVDHKPIEVR